jgi:glycerol-3-phosphate acyltransferase PlsY
LDQPPLLLAAALIGGYLLGSIPFGVITARLGGAGDLRKVGSGNIGATNVLRTGRKDLALITLIGDGGKGAAAVLIARWLTLRLTGDGDIALLAAVLTGGAAFLGHLLPLWLKFRGGKGVATFFGILLAISWPVGLLAGATWLLTAFLFRISSLAALAASAAAPLYAFAADHLLPVSDRIDPHMPAHLALFMAVLVWLRHLPNLRRLLKGEEPRIGARKPDPA